MKQKHRIVVGRRRDVDASIRKIQAEGGLTLWPEVTEYYIHKYRRKLGLSCSLIFSQVLAKSQPGEYTSDITNHELSAGSRTSMSLVQKCLYRLECDGLITVRKHERLGYRIIDASPAIYEEFPEWYAPCPMMRIMLGIDTMEQRDEDVAEAYRAWRARIA